MNRKERTKKLRKSLEYMPREKLIERASHYYEETLRLLSRLESLESLKERAEERCSAVMGHVVESDTNYNFYRRNRLVKRGYTKVHLPDLMEEIKDIERRYDSIVRTAEVKGYISQREIFDILIIALKKIAGAENRYNIRSRKDAAIEAEMALNKAQRIFVRRKRHMKKIGLVDGNDAFTEKKKGSSLKPVKTRAR